MMIAAVAVVAAVPRGQELLGWRSFTSSNSRRCSTNIRRRRDLLPTTLLNVTAVVAVVGVRLVVVVGRGPHGLMVRRGAAGQSGRSLVVAAPLGIYYIVSSIQLRRPARFLLCFCLCLSF